MNAGLSAEMFTLLCIDARACAREMAMHAPEYRDAVCAYYAMSWARQIEPSQFAVFVECIDAVRKEAAR